MYAASCRTSFPASDGVVWTPARVLPERNAPLAGSARKESAAVLWAVNACTVVLALRVSTAAGETRMAVAMTNFAAVWFIRFTFLSPEWAILRMKNGRLRLCARLTGVFQVLRPHILRTVTIRPKPYILPVPANADRTPSSLSVSLHKCLQTRRPPDPAERPQAPSTSG